MSDTTAHEAVADALTRAAEWVLTHPDVQPPNVNVNVFEPQRFELTWFTGSDHDAAAAIIAAIPGAWADSAHSQCCDLTSDDVRATIFYDRAPKTAEVTLVDLLAMGAAS